MNIHCQWRAGKNFPSPRRAKLLNLINAVVELAGGKTLHCVSVTFLAPDAMARVNEQFLGHHGPTDVICFDYRYVDEPMTENADPDEPETELFLCPAVALREARKRALPYSDELTLYLAHGFLHAAGYDDLQPELKRKMRRAESRVMSALPDECRGLFPEPTAEVFP